MLQQVNATVTNSAAVVSATIPNNVSYMQIHNPHPTASIAFTIDGSTPVVNGNGITLGPLVTATYDNPGGSTFTGGTGMKAISSVSSQSVTIIWGLQ
jgi:hypothetical protein